MIVALYFSLPVVTARESVAGHVNWMEPTIVFAGTGAPVGYATVNTTVPFAAEDFVEVKSFFWALIAFTTADPAAEAVIVGTAVE